MSAHREPYITAAFNFLFFPTNYIFVNTVGNILLLYGGSVSGGGEGIHGKILSIYLRTTYFLRRTGSPTMTLTHIALRACSALPCCHIYDNAIRNDIL